MSDIADVADLHNRCVRLLGNDSSVAIKNVKIEQRGGKLGRIMVSIVSPPKIDKYGNTWTAAGTVYDTMAPVQEQLLSKIRDHVLPLLRRHMILDDLADV